VCTYTASLRVSADGAGGEESPVAELERWGTV